jgi:hypothetical protein
MLGRLRSHLAVYILRPFSSVRELVANPKKLQKRITVQKNTKFLHKDVKVKRKKIPTEVSENEWESLTQRVIQSTLGQSNANQ